MPGGAVADPYLAARMAVGTPVTIISAANPIAAYPRRWCSLTRFAEINITCATKRPTHRVIINPWTWTRSDGSGAATNPLA